MCDRGMCSMRVCDPWMIREKHSCLKLINILHKGQPCTLVVQLMYLSCIVNVTLLYDDANFTHMYKSCPHVSMIWHNRIKANKTFFYFMFINFV